MALLATLCIASLFIDVGFCDSDMDNLKAINLESIQSEIDNLTSSINSSDASSGKLEYVGSFDQHKAISYSMGTMGMSNKMTSFLTLLDDGSIEKSRNTAMFSFGSDLLNAEDVSEFSGIDALGNEYRKTYQKSITIKNSELPFMIISNDLARLSAQGIDADNTYSKTYILLPDLYSADQINGLSAALGDSSDISIKTFKYGSNMNDMFRLLDLDLNMGLYFGSFPWAEAFSALMGNKEIWELYRKGAIDQLNKKNEEEEEDDIDILYDTGWGDWDSAGGISCKRHNYIT